MRTHLIWLTALLLAATAHAQTGVSDDRVSLPEGPGSLEGVGDDVDINPNMGAMSYTIDVKVPEGFPGLTPPTDLSYSSSAGASVLGIGWSMPESSIERLTLRGVPRYDIDDEFEVDRGDQLVLISAEGGDQVYRARFEGGFVRYTWREVGDGSEGYWIAEYPDGTIGWYGADAEGNLIDAARVGGDEGTFRYLLAEVRDSYEHRLVYTYAAHGSTALLDKIEYVFTEGDPLYRVEYAYEDREDWISDASGGFEEVLDQRLSGITVYSRGTPIRRYGLTYEDYATSGGFSRLIQSQLYGLGDLAYPTAFTFEYAQGLGDVCRDGDGCQQPFIASMGSIGVNLQAGRTQLVDVNGDALPDIIDASIEGAPHRIFLNVLGADGSHGFNAPYDSQVGGFAGHDFSSAYVKVLDANGDGFTDAVNATTGAVLLNRGNGDWEEEIQLDGFDELAALGEAELQAIRFLDYDNDRRIDFIRSTGAGDGNIVTVYANTDAGFEAVDVDPIGAGFDSDAIEFNDMNGDGLLDVVQVQEDQVRYRINRGYGRWSPEWLVAGGEFSFDAAQAVAAELEDLNGDGLSDLTLVEGDTVYVWVNRNGRDFEALEPITSADIDGTLPTREGTTTVLFADMNGNGSSDIVWIQQGGEVEYLELFPTRPNLISRIENGLGMITTVTYGTSVEHMARDGGAEAWAHRLPFPNVVVDAVDEWEPLTDVHRITAYTYHDGFYDGVEKQFRGFAVVESDLAGDESQEAGRKAMRYDIGDASPYYAGLLLEESTESGGRPIQAMSNNYEECAVADIPEEGLRFPIRHICQTSTETEVREGAPESEWVQLREERQFDGYGNVTLEIKHGVVSIGGGACGPCDREPGEYGAPCGPDCLGDEAYTETTYTAPTGEIGGWLLGQMATERRYSEAGASDYAEVRAYYDGPDFEGLPLGQATAGFISRIEHRVNAQDEFITVSRLRADAHGNAVEELDALGEPGGDGHRRVYTYDAAGLHVTRVEIMLHDDAGAYALQRDVLYDDLWDLPILSTEWRVAVDGVAEGPAISTNRAYDPFGRLSALALPGGDTIQAPTTEYVYDEGTPSRVIERTRSVAGAAEADLEKVHCFDGRGRRFQQRDRVEEGLYQVSGFEVYSVRGLERELFQPYTSADAGCDVAPPEGVLSVRREYDAMGRLLRLHSPDGEGGWLTSRVEHHPLEVWTYDLNDTDPEHPHFDTPTIRVNDGLERLVATGRVPAEGAEPEWFTQTYGPLSLITRVTDPLGNSRTQTHDLRGRVTRALDPDRGETVYEYDDVGNRIREENATGAVSRTYDGTGRLLTEWEEGAEGVIGAEQVWDRAAGCPEGLCQNTAGKLVARRYEALGQPITDWFSYDLRARGTHFARQIGGATLTLETRYDNAGRLVGYTFPGGRDLDITLDEAGRARAIPGFIDAIVPTEQNTLDRLQFANGLTLTYQHDARRRPVQQRLSDGAGVDLIHLTYDLDAQGLLRGISDGAPQEGLPTHAATFEYDAFERLTAATLSVGDAAFEETLTYTYDAADNLTARESSLGAASPAHDGVRVFDDARPHAVTLAGATRYAYDAAGFMVERGAATLSWDAFGRLTALSEGERVLTEHGYSDQDSRALTRAGDSVTHYMPEGFTVEDGVASMYVTLGNQTVARLEYADLAPTLLSDLSADGAITAGDAWLAFAQAQGLMDPQGEADSAEVLLTSSAALGLLGDADRLTFLHRDRVDNLIAVTGAEGEVVERSYHYPFGASRLRTTNAPEGQSVTDMREDPTSGLVFFGARFYDPSLGRWTAPDQAFETLTAEQLINPWEALGNYVYGWNSPQNGQDEDGAVWSNQQKSDFLQVLRTANDYSTGGVYNPHFSSRATALALNRLNGGYNAGSKLSAIAGMLKVLHDNRDSIVAELGRIATHGTAAERQRALTGLNHLQNALNPANMKSMLDRHMAEDVSQAMSLSETRSKLTEVWNAQKEYNTAVSNLGVTYAGSDNAAMTKAGYGGVSNNVMVTHKIMSENERALRPSGQSFGNKVKKFFSKKSNNNNQ